MCCNVGKYIQGDIIMNENFETTENKIEVPYIVYEGELARAERQTKRLWIALIVAIVAFVSLKIVQNSRT